MMMTYGRHNQVPTGQTLISGDKQKLSPHFDELKSPFVEDRLDGTSPHSCPS